MNGSPGSHERIHTLCMTLSPPDAGLVVPDQPARKPSQTLEQLPGTQQQILRFSGSGSYIGPGRPAGAGGAYQPARDPIPFLPTTGTRTVGSAVEDCLIPLPPEGELGQLAGVSLASKRSRPPENIWRPVHPRCEERPGLLRRRTPGVWSVHSTKRPPYPSSSKGNITRRVLIRRVR